ncbi:MAG: 2-aminomuconate deaminase [Candidatus Marinimicrobia bacterium]|nr:2-aminomuconate deaminase [Candidatus Neomarinimicrobiota bacterium]|tara:strand:+ start:124 stop:537 length:414 start_codon:yes stop_codon:yes gene_type:complete
MSDVINATNAPIPVGKYPHARKVGNLLFLSGVGPRKPGTNTIPGVMMDGQGNVIGHDIEAQCHSVFENVKIILDESGSSWDNLVDITVFLTNMKRDFDIFNKIYGDYFINNQPCRTTLEVRSLPTPIAIELKCIATV